MFGLKTRSWVLVAPGTTNIRKGFDGLFGLVRDALGEDPFSGHLFRFADRDRTLVKVLVFDGSGIWVCSKRLEKGRFAWPAAAEGQTRIAMRTEEVTMLLRGSDLEQTRVRKRFLRFVAA